VELGEVEARLAAHPALDRAVVVAREDQPGQKRLVAYIVPRGAEAPTTSELRGWVGAVLPDYMVPAAFVVLAALPLNPNGKTDRAALPVPSGARPELAAGFDAPRSATEARLAEVWGEVLGVDRVGVHDDFFELGGDSILSIQVMAAARRAGLTITPRQVFDHRSVASLAAAVDTDDAVEMAAEQGTVTGTCRRRDPALVPVRRLPGRPVRPVDPAAVARAGRRRRAPHRAGGPGRPPRRAAAPGRRRRPAHRCGEDHELVVDAAEPGAADVHRSLDLARGPVVRAALVAPDETLIVAHHLAVDVVSWNILVEDLDTAYRQARAGRPIALPPDDLLPAVGPAAGRPRRQRRVRRRGGLVAHAPARPGAVSRWTTTAAPTPTGRRPR